MVDILMAGNLKIDSNLREVTVSGERLKLSIKEFDLLNALAQNLKKVLTREQLMKLVWDSEYYGNTRTVDMHIKQVRAKINGASVTIETIRGLGYKMIPKG